MKELTVAVHNGQFHADETTAVALLKIIRNIKIVRTRDPSQLAKADIVVDVGKVYDPENFKFDHHQYSPDESPRFSDKYSIPMSSVGMVYKHFGKEILSTIIKKMEIETNEEDLDMLYDTVYRSFVQEIDAIDNGIDFQTSVPKYNIYTYLSATITKFNTMQVHNDELQFLAFTRAVDYAKTTFLVHLESLLSKHREMKSDIVTISNAMKNRYSYSDTGELLVVDVDCPNWLYCLRDFENKNKYKDDEKEVKFILYPDETGFRIRAIPGQQKFENRSTLKQINEFETLFSDNEIKDIVFVHKAGFIGGALNKQTALKMGKFSL